MQNFVAWSDEIEGRLDCFFYAPKNQVSIKSKFPLVTVKDVTNNVIHPPEYKRIYAAYGLQLLRAQNVKPLGIEINSNRVFFDKNYLKGKKLIFPEIGDVLVVRSGVNTGDCAVIEKDYADVILGADNLVCKCKDEINPFFLKIYLSLNVGRKMLNLYQTGATNYHITPENLKKIKIPLPPLSIQNQIVEIMQAAYSQKKQKEAEAQRLLDSIDSYVLDELGIKLPEVENEVCFIVNSYNAMSRRLDPKAFLEIPRTILKAIKNCNFSIKPLSEIIIENIAGNWGSEPSKEGDLENSVLINVLRNTNFDNQFNLNLKEVAQRLIPSNKLEKIKLWDGDLLVEKSGGSPTQPVGRVAIFENIESDYTFSNFLQCIRVNNKECLSYYLFSFLKTLYRMNYMEYVQNQTTGIKNLIMEEYLSIPIPLPPLEIQNKIAEEVRRQISEAERLKTEAGKIIEEAKKKVEEMLLGHN